jgi:phosphoribosyl 1,2-cyclic phosphodiesterase
MKITVWGARGSIPAPGPETVRYGGNTSCVQVELDDGTHLILDAGTGIRPLGQAFGQGQTVNVLLTHLHLDHIQGLVFFQPCFDPESNLRVWGPSSPVGTLQDRIARYVSAPLSPIEVRELPCDVSFQDAPETEWEIGSARITAASVAHRGPTLGYRITEGDTTLCYIPDHEPALGVPLADLEEDWISGFQLAKGASLLMHDCQYFDAEYPKHIGWGHSRLTDSLTFARRVEAEQVLLFHHDPLHSDADLDRLHSAACEQWVADGGDAQVLEMAVEGEELHVTPTAAPLDGNSRAQASAVGAAAGSVGGPAPQPPATL